jgi:cold shock CspA family protein
MQDGGERLHTDGLESGVVVKWWDAKGYGFILPKGQRGGRDLFFLATAARRQAGEYITFSEGERVYFQRGRDDRGRECAVFVEREEERHAS